MRIDTVIYKNDKGIEEFINLSEITARDDYEVVKKNLHCAYEGCSARIEYVPKGLKVAFFRTWRNDDHSTECENFFEREKIKAALRNTASDTAKLTDTHIRDVLKGMNKSVKESAEEKELRLEKQREYASSRKNTTIDGSQEPISGNFARPTTDKEADYQAEGTRAPRVKRRYSPDDIIEADVGIATGIVGTVASMQLFEKRAIISLKKRSGQFNIYLEEDFFSDAALNIDITLELLKDTISNNNDYLFFCVGNIEKRDNRLCMIVNSQNHIQINDLSIASFVFRNSNPKLF